MKDKLLIGIITKPQGIKGEVKIKNLTDGVQSLDYLKEVYIDGIPYKVLHKRSSGEDVFLTLKGVADRNGAELLRNKEIYADREQIAKEEDCYFVVDILGCNVFTDKGEYVGKVVNIVSGRTDIYYAENETNTAIFPMIKALNPIFDVESKKITINGEKLLEVVMYED